MGHSVFGYILFAVLICAPLSAIGAITVSGMRGRFQIVDIGTLLLPPLAFFVIGSLRSELHMGWAMLFWPIIVAVVSMYAVALKIFAIDPITSSARPISVGLFCVCAVAAALLALFVPPWYD